jgi:Tfp pilus assembly protein PilF
MDVKRRLLREAEDSLRACLQVDPADPRSYVVLGKLLVQQKRYDEARKLYADGTTATGEHLGTVHRGCRAAGRIADICIFCRRQLGSA